jgi:spermidine synthase
VEFVERLVTRGRVICLLYGISGCAGLAYETAWIRAFTTSFGNTLLSFSTVISVYLGGLALGAAAGGRFRTRRGLAWNGAAEIFIGVYALAIPLLMEQSTALLVPLYCSSGAGRLDVARVLLCAAILLPATIPMGASLPWLASWLRDNEPSHRLSWIYAINTLGGAAGAVLTGLFLLPGLGYQRVVVTASVFDIAVGLASLGIARAATQSSGERRSLPIRSQTGQPSPIPLRTLVAVAILSGWCAMLYEVTWNRVAGLLFGPTAVTVTLTLAVVLIGLAAGAILASASRKNEAGWLALSQLAAAILLLGVSYAVAVSPTWLAEQIRAHSEDPFQLELLEAGVLFLLLFPVTMAAGMALPLTLRMLGTTRADAVGKLYGLNAAGCIGGTLVTGWFLVPHFGMERALYIGALLSGGASVLLAGANSLGRVRRTAAIATVALAIAAFLFPQWDLAAMTAGAYKYAPYYNHAIASELHTGELVYLREGTAGTVTVRRIDGSLVLAIDGKVDATDAGGDLLTEKLLAHLPLHLVARPRTVCVIGLASGVTAGAALKYPIEQLDVVELSPEVVQASHFFDSVNGLPLGDRRTHLIVNDGRNHLALTGRRYDAILSEPSNPWIAGMNSLFTREFFRLARSRLNPGGVLAQWFHLYNMPANDLQSLLRAFTDVFPSATLWQLNDGDVLLTGPASETATDPTAGPLPAPAAADLAAVGVPEPALFSTLYVMRGSDLARFAEAAEPNTDDRPVLEFHGQRNLSSQTDAQNVEELTHAPKKLSPSPPFQVDGQRISPNQWLDRGRMFEKAESYRMAFGSYQKALAARPDLSEALAGLMRSARTPDERAMAGTLDSRTQEALADAQAGNVGAAEWILRALKQAYPQEPESHFNYGLFCLERSRSDEAIENFIAAIAARKDYLPAFEALAETYLRRADFPNATLWTRRILEIDPGHAVARQTLAGIQKQITGSASQR